jgi:hypothetical protein
MIINVINTNLRTSLCSKLNRAATYVYAAKARVIDCEVDAALIRIERAIAMLTEIRNQIEASPSSLWQQSSIPIAF